jgi:hypothetical protein
VNVADDKNAQKSPDGLPIIDPGNVT